jgi:hypothetical protein
MSRNPENWAATLGALMMSGARRVSLSSRLTKLRLNPSALAISPAESGSGPSSNICFDRCALASARISASSGRGFAGAHASPPSAR